MNRFSQRLISSLVALATTGGAVALTGTAARSADMLADQGQEYTQVEFGTGWYLRGEVGSTYTETTASVLNGDNTFINDRTIGEAQSFGIGGGYMINPSLRAEVGINTYTGFAHSAAAEPYQCPSYFGNVTEEVDTVVTPDPVFDPVSGNFVQGPDYVVTELQTVERILQDDGECYRKWQADISISTLMGKLFVDGPTFKGITPYAGIGAGLAIVSWDEYKDFDLCLGSAATHCQGQGGGVFTLREGTAETQANFSPAFSFMVGGAYEISKNLKLDVGYTYTSIAGVTIASAADNTFYDSDLKMDDFAVHEIRVGLRYEIW